MTLKATMSKKMKIIPSIFKSNQPWQWPSPCHHPKTLSFRLPDDASPPSAARLSERLFFEPEETSSIVRRRLQASSPFKDSVAMALESDDPYIDFKRSMEEMVESRGLFDDWDCLEELLSWYLRMNRKMNHGFIVGAFVDLLVAFAAKTKTQTCDTVLSGETSTVYSSASSSFSSLSCVVD
ncbi:transcription repressor OFP15-like [Salvia hispanica]|uniref:transcription repressor OFP15-like n=1 Tax=Salvia hispanica TaxID=49212 RepID=UPI002008F6B3|nr:transcription repressor OFP15-like [Salvia hispanica]